MDTNRFRRRDYTNLPSRKPVTPPPIVDGIDQAKSTPPMVSQTHATTNEVPHYTQLTPKQASPTTQPAAQHAEAPQPVWAQPRSMAPVQPDTAASAASTTINVNVSLPKFSRPKVKLPKPSKKTIKISLGVLIAVALVVALGLAAKHFLIHPKPAVAYGSAKQAAALKSPTFKPVAPSAKQDLASATAAGTSFDGTKNVYSYSDRVDGKTIVVSQQPVPPGFATAQAAVDKIAPTIGAKSTLKLANGSTAYVATDGKSNSQILVLTVNNLLVFIQSPFTQSASIWQNYIASLK